MNAIRLIIPFAQSTSQEFLEATFRSRVGAFSALVLIVILGIGLILFTWISGRIARKFVSRDSSWNEANPVRSIKDDDWSTKPIIPPVDNESATDRDRNRN